MIPAQQPAHTGPRVGWSSGVSHAAQTGATTTESRPSANARSISISCQLSAVSYQLSTISYQLSAAASIAALPPGRGCICHFNPLRVGPQPFQ
jgi:hypothetical protein